MILSDRALATAQKVEAQKAVASKLQIGKVTEVHKQFGFAIAEVNRRVVSSDRLRIDVNGRTLVVKGEKQNGSKLSVTIEGVEISESLIGV